jgi:hypothetical protein
MAALALAANTSRRELGRNRTLEISVAKVGKEPNVTDAGLFTNVRSSGTKVPHFAKDPPILNVVFKRLVAQETSVTSDLTLEVTKPGILGCVKLTT